MPVATIAPTAQWTMQKIDLSAYTGHLVQLQWVWQGSAPTDAGQEGGRWIVDDVEVTVVSMPATDTSTESATQIPIPTTLLTNTPVSTTVSPTTPPTPAPTAVLTPTSLPTEVPTAAPTPTSLPTEVPTAEQTGEAAG